MPRKQQEQLKAKVIKAQNEAAKAAAKAAKLLEKYQRQQSFHRAQPSLPPVLK
jgi:hypothetical protein